RAKKRGGGGGYNGGATQRTPHGMMGRTRHPPGSALTDDIPAMSEELPPNTEPTRSPPASSLYFEVAPFQPDGGAPFLGVLLTLGLLAPGGLVAGWLLSALIPLVWAVPVIPEEILFLVLVLAFFGLGAAALVPGRWGLRWGRIRNPLVAGAAGVFGVAVIVFTLARGEYHRMLGQPNIRFEDILSWLAYGLGAISLAGFAT